MAPLSARTEVSNNPPPNIFGAMDRSPRTAAIVVLLLLSAATLMAGCTQQQPLTVKLTDHPTYGKILTDSTGRSLYVQARDVPNTGAVANLGEVGRFYPPFYAESVTGGNGINVSEFGYLIRADGKRQTTFRGWPLYYYLNDRATGDAKSQGANNITFLAKPDYTVMVRENATLGIYLSDTTGAALLVRDSDAPAGPTPGYAPFRASPVLGPSPLVQAEDFAETVGPSGDPQTAYRGQPLFSFSGQARPGAIAGDTDGYRPVVLAPGGTLTDVTETATAAPSPSPSVAGTGTAPTTDPAATTNPAAAVRTRSRDDAYTGGVYTPTPFQTVRLSSQSTESATPTAIWTPIVPEATTAAPVTPLPTVSSPTATPTPPITLSPATPTTSPTGLRTPVVTATSTVIVTPTTAPPTPAPTTTPTPLPTTVPLPVTPAPTTVPLPITPSPTTLPLPFPITTLEPNPAVSTQNGNTS
jgi:predicted lipoprotein with Yx(FWY)xxD motif